MNFEDLTGKLEELSREFGSTLERIETNLDPRVGELYSDPDRTLIASKHPRQLNYYGGFEYIDSEYVLQVGEWTVYSGEHERVAEALDSAN